MASARRSGFPPKIALASVQDLAVAEFSLDSLVNDEKVALDVAFLVNDVAGSVFADEFLQCVHFFSGSMVKIILVEIDRFVNFSPLIIFFFSRAKAAGRLPWPWFYLTISQPGARGRVFSHVT
jgi:hypothetical protein